MPVFKSPQHIVEDSILDVFKFSSMLKSPPKYAWFPRDLAQTVFPTLVGPMSTRLLARSTKLLVKWYIARPPGAASRGSGRASRRGAVLLIGHHYFENCSKAVGARAFASKRREFTYQCHSPPVRRPKFALAHESSAPTLSGMKAMCSGCRYGSGTI